LNIYAANIQDLDLNGLTLRRRTLYPTEVQRPACCAVTIVYHIPKRFARVFEGMRMKIRFSDDTAWYFSAGYGEKK